MNPFYDLLYKTPAINIVPTSRGLISLKDNQTVLTALKRLSDHKILSAPVFDGENNLVGMVDIFDIVTFLFSEKGPDDSKPLEPLTQKETAALKKKAEQTKIRQVANVSGRSPIVPFYGDNPLSLLVELFAQQVKLHRVALFTKDGQLVRPCSQTDAVGFLARHLEDTKEIKRLMQKTVQELVKEQKRAIVTVQPTTPLRECLVKLAGADIYGLAVVDSEGKLVSQFAFSDLRGLEQDSFKSLGLGVMEFLKDSSRGLVEPHTIDSKASLHDVIQEFCKYKCHRLWVTDGDEKPTGLIELTDVMKCAASGERVTETQVSGGITKLWFPFRTLGLETPSPAPSTPSKEKEKEKDES